MVERESSNLRRLKLALGPEPRELAKTRRIDLGADVDSVDSSLAELLGRRGTPHRGHRSAFPHDFAEPRQRRRIADGVDDRCHTAAVPRIERLQNIAGAAIDD